MKIRIGSLFVGLLLLTGLWTMWSAAIPGPVSPYRAPAIEESVWLNSPPLRLADLEGRVVLVEFWTYGCFNCWNVEPYMKKWYQRYHEQGLEIIAVHSPEFAREHRLENVRAHLEQHKILYPVVLDNDFRIWKAWSNHYWPALYLVDKRGKVRYRHIGEGAYRRTEKMIRKLLAESGPPG